MRGRGSWRGENQHRDRGIVHVNHLSSQPVSDHAVNIPRRPRINRTNTNPYGESPPPPDAVPLLYESRPIGYPGTPSNFYIPIPLLPDRPPFADEYHSAFGHRPDGPPQQNHQPYADERGTPQQHDFQEFEPHSDGPFHDFHQPFRPQNIGGQEPNIGNHYWIDGTTGVAYLIPPEDLGFYDDTHYLETIHPNQPPMIVQGNDTDCNPPDTSNDQAIRLVEYSNPLSDIKGGIIGIEANYYIEQLLNSTGSFEPLVPAIGGVPLRFKKAVENDLDNFKKFKIIPYFIFQGQSVVGEEEVAVDKALLSAAKINNAWISYSHNQADDAVRTFGASSSSNKKPIAYGIFADKVTEAIVPQSLHKFLQKILLDRGEKFDVVGASVGGQMAYWVSLPGHEPPHINGLYGSYELLLYSLHDTLITKLDFEHGIVIGLHRADVFKSLNITEDQFIDAFLMTGTAYIPPFPALLDTSIVQKQPYTINDALNMLRASNKSVRSVCQTFGDLLQKKDPKWLEKFMKARQAVEHYVYRAYDGNKTVYKVSNYDTLTEDHRLIVGLKSAEELYYYVSKGLIGPKLLHWIEFTDALIGPPLDGGETEEYRRLVTQQLIPTLEQTMVLVISRLHRAFQYQSFPLRFWFDRDSQGINLNPRGGQTPLDKTKTWCVPKASYQTQEDNTSALPGTFRFALIALEDEAFAKTTIAKAPQVSTIKTTEEISANTIWRFLHLRGYINDDHTLSEWGKALSVTLKALKPTDNQEEAAVLAFELIRYDQLNAKNPHPELYAGPANGTDEQKAFCLLVSRCACLLKLRHDPIGYTGPLNQNLMSFYSVISAVRSADRDLMESVVASMFLFANADRFDHTQKSILGGPKARGDWAQIGLNLPFLVDNNIGLGIAVKTYLDESASGELTNDSKAELRKKYQKYPIAHAPNIQGDLAAAFAFFDALQLGVKAVGKDVADQEVWAGARKYLSERR